MNKIRDMLQREFIIQDLKATGKKDVLEELVHVFAEQNGGMDSETMVRVLLEREKLGSTGIGDGIAIPHGKLAGIEEILVGFGRSRAGVDFNSLDGRPVHLFFIIMAPDTSSAKYLKVLAKISRMLKDPKMRKDLLEAASVDDLYRIIETMDQKIV
jgi:PTS system nitrogen regulatory IIA component